MWQLLFVAVAAAANEIFIAPHFLVESCNGGIDATVAKLTILPPITCKLLSKGRLLCVSNPETEGSLFLSVTYCQQKKKWTDIEVKFEGFASSMPKNSNCRLSLVFANYTNKIDILGYDDCLSVKAVTAEGETIVVRKEYCRFSEAYAHLATFDGYEWCTAVHLTVEVPNFSIFLRQPTRKVPCMQREESYSSL